MQNYIENIMPLKRNLCVTCLSSDRRLIPLNKMECLIQELHFCELAISDEGICWECEAVMKKFYRFRIQVQTAQKALKKSTNIKSLSRLSKNLNISCDPLTAAEVVVTETKYCIKEEIDESNNFDDNILNNDDSILNFVDTIPNFNETIPNIGERCPSIVKNVNTHDKTTKKVKNKNRVVKNSKAKNNDVKKFVQVLLTEEEIARNREEKRNHPNFKKIPYKCDSCVLGFTRKETYDVHMEKKHDETIGPHLCDVCHTRFPTSAAMERHRRRHFSCYRCVLCKHECAELWSAASHGRAKHSADRPDSIHCAQCDTVVRTAEDLEEHIQTKHTIHCSDCGGKFKSRNTLRRHMRHIHAVKREFVCDICTKAFVTKTRLESHMAHHSGTIAKKLAYCYVCHVQYKNIYVYRNHLKHSANHLERACQQLGCGQCADMDLTVLYEYQVYPCPKCEKKFVCKKYRNEHYNFYHLKKSQYHCKICNKLFISEWRLTNHRQKHHGLSRSRDHPCNICGKKFFTKSTLRGHQLTHSEQRSYMCEDCGDTFKQRPALYTHARLVHSARPNSK